MSEERRPAARRSGAVSGLGLQGHRILRGARRDAPVAPPSPPSPDGVPGHQGSGGRPRPGCVPADSGHRASVVRDAAPGMIRACRSRSGMSRPGLRSPFPASTGRARVVAGLGWIGMAATLAAVGRQRRPRPGHAGERAGRRRVRPRLGDRAARPAARRPRRPAAAPRPAERRLLGRGGDRPVLGRRRPGDVVADLRRAERPAARRRLGRVLVRLSASAPGCCSACRCCCCSTPTDGCPPGRWRHGVARQPRLHRRPAGPAARRTVGHRRPPVGNPVPAVYRALDLDPTSLPLPEGVLLPLLQIAFPLVALGVLVPLAVVAHRLRQATGESRRRMRWLLWAGVVDALVMLGALVFPTSTVSYDLALAVGLTGLAVTLGILRPRAVDIDRLLGGDPRLRRPRRRRRRPRPGRAGRRGRAARRQVRRGERDPR